MSNDRGRTLEGVIVSDKRQQTIAVEVVRHVKHPLYDKYVVRSKKFHAHDAENQGKVGDKVRIRECRPVSKTKTWVLDEILEKAN